MKNVTNTTFKVWSFRKQIFKKSTLIIILSLSLMIPLSIFSQDAPPPPPPTHGSSGNQGPSDAPIAGGLFILLGLGGIYGGYKGYKLYNEKKRDGEQ
ncbi:hypothetical protein ACFLRY_02660 [Bacteroidota bacterium]